MKTYQRTSGWILLLMYLLGMMKQDWLSGLLQIEKSGLLILLLIGLVSLASVKRGWIRIWTLCSGLLFFAIGIIGFVWPGWVHHQIAPLEALLALALSTWGIFQYLKTNPTLPTA